MNVKVAVPEIPMLAKKQIAEKSLKIDRRIVDAFHKILIVCPHQCIAEIPGMVCEKFIIDVEAYGTEILYGKDSCGARVSLAECMDLPYPGDKACQVGDHFVPGDSFVTVCAFLRDVIFQGPVQIFPIQVTDRRSFKHPFFLRDVIVANSSGMFEYTVKNSPVQRYDTVRTEIECSRR